MNSTDKMIDLVLSSSSLEELKAKIVHLEDKLAVLKELEELVPEMADIDIE